MTQEALLAATRDGYINLALAILQFVNDVDRGRIPVEDEVSAYWDDNVARHLLGMPNDFVILTNALFINHSDLSQCMKETCSYDPDSLNNLMYTHNIKSPKTKAQPGAGMEWLKYLPLRSRR
jgi:hypothetical protein